jgi:hypothetical protein
MKNQKKSTKPTNVFIIMIFVVIVIWYLSFYLLKDSPDRGTFGDMFGGINALFSGLAFAGLIYTILLQREELELQRNELKETKDEFKTQNKTLKRQRFENTFFNLLDLHHKIIDGIDKDEKIRVAGGGIRDSKYQVVSVRGRDVFRKEYYWLVELFRSNEVEDNPKTFNDIYLKKYEDVQTDFGHYFRNLYRILKFIDSTDFYPLENSENKDIRNNEIRYSYTSILRAQLSDYEILWLFYNCLSLNGKDRFKGLVEKYCIFKNIPSDKLHKEEEINLFKKVAYERNPSA